jgi:hypothetical protein
VKPFTKTQLISALQKIEKRWPEGYSLFSWSGSLCLMEGDVFEKGTSANDKVVATFPGIPNDGGDP